MLTRNEQQLVQRFRSLAAVRAAEKRPDLNVQLVCPNGDYLFVDGSSEALAGFDSRHLMRISPWTLVHPDDRKVAREMVDRVYGGECVKAVLRIQTIRGKYRWHCYQAELFEGAFAAFVTAAQAPRQARKRVAATPSMLKITEEWASNRSQRPTSQGGQLWPTAGHSLRGPWP